MPRSDKANLPWVETIGAKIAIGLSDRYARPMIYRQSGPYNQSKTPHVGIYFNDPILHYITPAKPGQKVDFRFGFYLERCFSSDRETQVILVGFDIFNPTLSHRFLMPNIRSQREPIAGKLIAWLRRHRANGGFVRCGIGDGKKHIIYSEDTPEMMAEVLGAYSRSSRKDESSPWKRAHFSAIILLPKYNGWNEVDLINGSSDLADSALTSFKRLDFLYSMLFPRELGPSRVSNGQNRALKSKQPDRRCAWDQNQHCLGDVDAAHIIADRVGGLAVAGNLIWLCQAHHKLLDVYLKAELSIDREARRVIASVRKSPPKRTLASGLPLAAWESIEDKKSWHLPLSVESINHLFLE
ncbi:HNH endonuclease signature motif containing protein [Tundrisphaera lichenicola]|uniref:HNH endonuclease signature motif containing protein n=1 Tax=Tundrisphaera lichenicola TaxID=2029860 RepID=UPI003EB7D015